MTEPTPIYDATSSTSEVDLSPPPTRLDATYIASKGRIDIAGTWAVAIDAVRDAARWLLTAQVLEEYAQIQVGHWKATILTEELLSGRINGSNDRIRKAQEEQWLDSHLDYQRFLSVLNDATAGRKRAEIELEYARLRERFWRVHNQATTVAT